MIYLAIELTSDGIINPNIASEDEATINQFCVDKQANYDPKDIEIYPDGYGFKVIETGARLEKHSIEIA